jgi:hypothetical protein
VVGFVGRKRARERETSEIARVGSGANARGGPGGKYMYYILEKCMYVRDKWKGSEVSVKWC